MKKFFKIVLWEFKTKSRSKSFIFTLLVSPLLLMMLIYIPGNQFYKDKNFRIAIIDASTDDFFSTIKNQNILSDELNLDLSRISADSNEVYLAIKNARDRTKFEMDSISKLYNSIKAQRKKIFQRLQRKNSTKDRKQLIALYDIQVNYRDNIDSLRNQHNKLIVETERSYIDESKRIANKLMAQNDIDAYFYLEPNIITTGRVEYHSIKPGHFLLKDQFEQMLTSLIIQNRLKTSKLNTRQTEKVLEPIELTTFQRRGTEFVASQSPADFYGPIIAIILLFIAIFTAAGYVFSSFVSEKNNHILEFVMGMVTKKQIYLGKIFGMSLTGIVQISVWALVIIILYQFELFELNKVPYLNIENLAFFFLYFILGYFLFALGMAGLSVVFNSEQESQNLNQVLRVLALFPILFALVVLEDPNSESIRYLSFIPILTPAFMVMRIPLSSIIPYNDILLTSIVMLISIIIVYLISYRVFKVVSNFYGKRLTFREIFKVIKEGKI